MPRLAVFAVLAVVGCARNQPSGIDVTPAPTRIVTGTGGTVTLQTMATSEVHSAVVQAPLERVWDALPSVYEALQVPVTTFVSRDHVIGNPSAKVRRKLGGEPMQRYLECGTGSGAQNAETYFITLAMHTRFRADPSGGTMVSTTVDATAVPPAFNSTDPVRCASTGRLERRVVALLTERLEM